MAKERIRVLLVDDHELARQGLRRVLELEEDMEVVGEASSAEEALEKVAALSPDIVLMDIKMPNTNGLAATRQLKENGLGGEVIILSLYDGYLAQAIEAGAGGYLTKDVKREDLADAIRRVHRGEMVLAQGLLTSPTLVEPALQGFRDMVRRRRAEGEPSPPASAPDPSPGEASLRKPEGPAAPLPPEPPRSPIDQGPAVPQSLPPQVAENLTPRVAETAEAPGQAREPAWFQDPLGEPFEEEAADDLQETPKGEMKKPEQSEYREEAFVVIPAPVNAASLVRLSRRLKVYHQVEILATGGSWDTGAWVRLRPNKPLDLKALLAQLPEVAQVWEIGPEDGDSLRNTEARRNPGATPGAQLRLVLKTAGTPEQLYLAI